MKAFIVLLLLLAAFPVAAQPETFTILVVMDFDPESRLPIFPDALVDLNPANPVAAGDGDGYLVIGEPSNEGTVLVLIRSSDGDVVALLVAENPTWFVESDVINADAALLSAGESHDATLAMIQAAGIGS